MHLPERREHQHDGDDDEEEFHALSPFGQAAVASARTAATWAIHSSDGTRLPLL